MEYSLLQNVLILLQEIRDELKELNSKSVKIRQDLSSLDQYSEWATRRSNTSAATPSGVNLQKRYWDQREDIDA